jgi:hypothetical protein
MWFIQGQMVGKTGACLQNKTKERGQILPLLYYLLPQGYYGIFISSAHKQ